MAYYYNSQQLGAPAITQAAGVTNSILRACLVTSWRRLAIRTN